MKFIFDKTYTEAMTEMENEISEREMTLNPSTCTKDSFKDFTCGFMFSTAKQLDLIREMNTKLDTAIELSQTNARHIREVTAEVATLKKDLQENVDNYDREFREVKADIATNKTSIQNLDSIIEDHKRENKREVELLHKLIEKLQKETLTLERYTRSFNVRVFNVPETPNEKQTDVMTKVNNLISEVTGKAIKVEYGHRTGALRTDNTNRPIICRIASRAEKMEVMSKRGDFYKKGRPIFDDLPAVDLVEKQKHSAFMKRMYELKHKTQFIRGKWFLDGVVYNG